MPFVFMDFQQLSISSWIVHKLWVFASLSQTLNISLSCLFELNDAISKSADYGLAALATAAIMEAVEVVISGVFAKHECLMMLPNSWPSYEKDNCYPLLVRISMWNFGCYCPLFSTSILGC